MTDLKLCPFCGDTAVLRTEIRPPSHVNDKWGYAAALDHDCPRGIRSHGLALFYSDKNDAETIALYDTMTKDLVSAWNYRPLDAAADKSLVMAREALITSQAALAAVQHASWFSRAEKGTQAHASQFQVRKAAEMVSQTLAQLQGGGNG